MKLQNCLQIIVVSFFCVSPTDASLVDNLDGTVTQTMLDGSGLMWLKDADYALTSNYPAADGFGRMTWQDALVWANDLVFAGYSDWRLPSALNSDGSYPCFGEFCDDSEMGNLYYNEGLSYSSLELSLGPFVTVLPDRYWSSTDAGGTAWDFHFGNQGYQDPNNNYSEYFYAWAVRDVTTVPVAGSLWLFGSGLIGLIGIAKRRQR